YQKNIALQEKLAAEYPTNPDYEYELAKSLRSFALYHGMTSYDSPEAARHLAQAEELDRRAQGLLEKVTRKNPTVSKYQEELVEIYNGLSQVYDRLNRVAEAGEVREQAVAICERLVRDNPAVANFQELLANSHEHLAKYHTATQQPAKA